MFPQEEAKERASQHLRRDEAAIIVVRQSSQMYVTVDQGFAGHESMVIHYSTARGGQMGLAR